MDEIQPQNQIPQIIPAKVTYDLIELYMGGLHLNKIFEN
jgi:hypothetical protein